MHGEDTMTPEAEQMLIESLRRLEGKLELIIEDRLFVMQKGQLAILQTMNRVYGSNDSTSESDGA